MSIFLFLILMGGPKPMNVMPGDPIIDIEVTTLGGAKVDFKDALDSSFCFILSTSCGRCIEALEQIQSRFQHDFHTVLLFVNPPDEVKAFLAKHLPLDHEMDIYTVEPKQLDPYDVHTVPAMLYYKNSRLGIGFHGPIDAKMTEQILNLQQRFRTDGE